MKETVTFREAKKDDYAFLADCIIAADRGHGKHCSYTQLFDLTEGAFHAIVLAMMEEELEGTELSPVHFLIADADGISVAAVSSWVEGAYDAPSWMIRSGLIYQYIPKENIENASALKHITDQMVLHRTEGTLQIEAVYTLPEYRGKGLATWLIREHAKRNSLKFPSLTRAELMLYAGNDAAMNAYSKLGFHEIKRKTADHPDVGKYYPSDGMLLMQSDIHNLL